MRKEAGTVGELLSVTLCMLAITVLLTNYMDCIQVLQQKLQVSQIARKYILKMETVGGLNVEEEFRLQEELEALGIAGIQIEATDAGQVTYGEEILLQIWGELENGYTFSEKRVSTAVTP